MKLLTNLLFEPKGKHDPALAYNIKDTVMSADGSKVYFALQDVPAGTALSNGDYWKLQIDLSSSKSAMDQALASFGNYAKSIGTRVRGETAGASGNPVTFLPDAGSLLQPVTVLDVQQAGSGDPSPSNIRPIIGCDAVKLNHAGKNLLNNVRYYDNTHTDIRAQYDSPLLLKAGVTYTLSTNFQADGLFFVDATGNGSLEAQYLLNYQYQTSELEYTPTRDIECLFVAIFNSGVPNGTTIQLEVGSATAHEPHQGKTHTVQFDHTVCGGRFEWLTGKGLIEWKAMRLLGKWVTSSMKYVPGYVGAWMGDILNDDLSEGQETILCSHLIGRVVYDWSRDGVYVYAGNTIGIQFSGASIPGYTDTGNADQNAGLVSAYLDANDVWVAWKLATPIEIQLTPHIISAADPEQTNTLYGDGVIEVEYVKPLHVSIEERVAAAVAAAMNTEGV